MCSNVLGDSQDRLQERGRCSYKSEIKWRKLIDICRLWDTGQASGVNLLSDKRTHSSVGHGSYGSVLHLNIVTGTYGQIPHTLIYMEAYGDWLCFRKPLHILICKNTYLLRFSSGLSDLTRRRNIELLVSALVPTLESESVGHRYGLGCPCEELNLYRRLMT